jgi:hypothetical protein
MKRRIQRPFLVLLCLSVFGCGPFSQTRVSGPPPRPAPAEAVFPEALIQKKIRFLQAILEEDALSKRDRDLALSLLDAYQLVQKTAQGPATDAACKGAVHALLYSLIQLDEDYFRRTKTAPGDYAIPLRLFSDKRDEIMEDYLAGDYGTVVRKCHRLKQDFGPAALTPEIALVFALSLAEEGMVEEAVDIGQGLMRQTETRPDRLYLASKLVEWQLRLDRREAAILAHERLTDDLDDRRALARHLDEQLRTREKITVVIEDLDDDTPFGKRPGTEEAPAMESLLARVDVLIQKGAYAEARRLLLSYRLGLGEDPETRLIDEALERVASAEEEVKRAEQGRENRTRQSLASARRLMEEERFEEAIAQLDALEQDQPGVAETEDLRREAVERLVSRERNRAARMFLAAQRTDDLEQKEAYLKDSYHILTKLLEKYPSSSLKKRINNHIRRIEEELDKLNRDTQ